MVKIKKWDKIHFLLQEEEKLLNEINEILIKSKISIKNVEELTKLFHEYNEVYYKIRKNS
jgi:Txe/YoeB family toxin of Txe-Axe toxin-antitoxin module